MPGEAARLANQQELVESVKKKYEKEKITVEITGVEMYEKTTSKGHLQFVALTVKCELIDNIRRDLGLIPRPPNYTQHITLLEKRLN